MMPLVAGVESRRSRVHGNRVGGVHPLETNLETIVVHIEVKMTSSIVA